ncbi:hypothetical protein F4778DRAFT_741179 [Xylariomycetidae sp. FL2044]|nr:hypothetical protein F4778DRAFT_741179 [Xylariomycetidae sp. FL2044]
MVDTNRKPHRCVDCMMDFGRRDLLQRHHSQYHEERDPSDPQPGGAATVAGRNPIACINCASAKTGCDKRVPCTRCAEKGLQCAARFARRSSKNAMRMRASQQTKPTIPAVPTTSPGGSPVSRPHSAAHPLPGLPEQTVNPALMDFKYGSSGEDSCAKTSQSPDANMTIDPRIHQHEAPGKNSSPAVSHNGAGDFPPAHERDGSIDDFMHLSTNFIQPEPFQDILPWSSPFPMHLEGVYNTEFLLPQADVAMPEFVAPSEISTTSNSNNGHMTPPSRSSVHTRGTSITSSENPDSRPKPMEMILPKPDHATLAEFDVVIAAEAAWPLARCTPLVYSASCPRTAIVHLECLKQKSEHEGTWSALTLHLEQVDWDAADLASVTPITSRTRDKMLAITQTFLHKALETHRGGVHGHTKQYPTIELACLVLPPSKILEYFLRSYVRSLSFFYSLVTTGCVDPNAMLRNNTAAALLVLLMIAQGAAAVPTAEARALSAGLIETCRISLFDIIEKDIEMSADPMALRCALLFTLLGSWSGDKWLMDIAMGQRGMYLSMLKHAGMLESQPSMIPSLNDSQNVEMQWRSWLQRETQNRLVYNWVMVDQELSLFHDTSPVLSITDLCAPMPGPELLWMSATAEQWVTAVRAVYGCTANVNPQLLTTPSLTPSLFDLFQDLLHDNLPRHQGALNPHQLRLLLHPLQSLLCHLRQMLSCFPDTMSTRHPSPRTVTKASTMQRLVEVQSLLQKWYELSASYAAVNPDCPVSKTNMVLYHLISLNAVTNFPEVERLARREAFDSTYWDLSLRHKRCIYQREEAIFHCGQVYRLLRSMAGDHRPSWWSVALYRATLILWTDSLARLDPNFQGKRDDAGGHVAVDQVTPEDQGVIAYLWHSEGVPVLTGRDGSPVASLEKPREVLDYGLKALQDDAGSRLSDGIRRKLVQLGGNWNMDGLGGPAPNA